MINEMDYISNYKANDINIYTKTTNAEFKWPRGSDPTTGTKPTWTHVWMEK